MKYLALLSITGLALVACNMGDGTDAQASSIQLDTTNGGYTTESEAANYGLTLGAADSEIATVSTVGADTLLPVETSDQASLASGHRYQVIILWGHAPPPRPAGGCGRGALLGDGASGMLPPPPPAGAGPMRGPEFPSDGGMAENLLPPPPPDGGMLDGLPPLPPPQGSGMMGGFPLPPPPPDGGTRPGLPPPPPAMDWSGAVSVSGGVVSVRRTIRFEDGDQVAPRTDTSRVDFVSRTTRFEDGLVLAVKSDSDTGAVLHFATTPYTGDFDLAQAATQGTVQEAGGNGSSVHVLVLENRAGCAQEILMGHAERRGDRVGEIRAHVMSTEGEVTGAMRGIWGERSDGTPVMFGKEVHPDGRFRGLMHGTHGEGQLEGGMTVPDAATPDRPLRGRLGDACPAQGPGLFLVRLGSMCQ